jgi:hypothetical protein
VTYYEYPTSLAGRDFQKTIIVADPRSNETHNTWEWLGRVSGAYVLPAQVTLSANYDHRSGTPQARQVLFTGGTTIPSITLNVDRLGSLRLPNTNVVDLRADKAFFLARQKVAVQLNLYNALNANTVIARSVLSGPTYLKPSAILGPRILEFSLSCSF